MFRLRTVASMLWMGVAAILPASGHFFWAETDPEAHSVEVTFSEGAGVPDKIIGIMEGRVTSVQQIAVDGTSVGVALRLNDDKTLLEGDLPPGQSFPSPSLVAGFLDFGSFEKFHDLRYTFGAQVYRSHADYEGFFRPLLHQSAHPTIVLRNCGGSSQGKTTSYQFDFGGFPEGPVGVCLYRKGGIRLDCGEFTPEQQQKPIVKVSERTAAVRNLRVAENRNTAGGFSMKFEGEPAVESETPYLLYAMANKTIVDKDSGAVDIMFASTSVYFEGPCQDQP